LAGIGKDTRVRTLTFLAVLWAVCALAAPDPAADSAKAPAAGLGHRLVFVRRNLTEERHVAEIQALVERSARLGFNGIVLSGGFDGIVGRPPEYFDRLRRVRSICEENRMELIPIGFSVGYAGGVLSKDPNLAAALPVRDVPFVVEKGVGVLIRDRSVAIANGGFETFDGERARGFDLQDGPGVLSRVDAVVRKEGNTSLRFEGLSKAEDGKGRLMQKVRVRPFRCYRITMWVKTEGLVPASRFQVSVLAGEKRVLMTWRPSLESTGDWRQVTFGFNSLTYEEVQLYVGVWHGKSGRFWIDDMRIEEVGILNAVRRAGTPVVVKNAATGAVYAEGRDYQRVEDAKLTYKFDHPDVALTALRGGAIRDGDRLTVSYYQALAIKAGGGQTSVCMSEARLYEMWTEEVRLLQETISPKYYFLSMDEIRQGGWCETCVGRGLTAGEILGSCITRLAGIIKRANPEAEIIVWSDMLDPNHNAKKDYYLFNGDFAGSWERIPKNLIIACWNYDTRQESLRHFDVAGFRTLGCGYYDMESANAAGDWASSLSKTPGAWGIMYTTWEDNYGFLDKFAARTIGAGKGGAGNP
jgi:hypothetical protein